MPVLFCSTRYKMQNRKTCELLQVHDITVLISDDSWQMGWLVLPSRSVVRLHYTNTDIYLKHHLHLIYAHPGNIACLNLIIIILKVIHCFNIRFRNIRHMEWSASERPQLLWMTSMNTQRAFATFTFQTWFYDTIYRR